MTIRSFAGKKCFITGAASGIGRATARAAAAEGAVVFLTDVDAAKLSGAVGEITGDGGTVGAHAALDIADHDAVHAFAREIHEEHGSMDVVMNIAGVSIWGTVQNLEHRHWRKTVEVNLMGPIHVIEAFVPAMIGPVRGATS